MLRIHLLALWNYKFTDETFLYLEKKKRIQERKSHYLASSYSMD